jgi:hypothetical protein
MTPVVSNGTRRWLWLAVLVWAIVIVLIAQVASRPPEEQRSATSPASTGGGSSAASLLLGAPSGISEDTGAPDVAIAGPLWSGSATWYCSSRSACTRGYGPRDMVAAIDPSLGIERGTLLTVSHGGAEVVVRIVDVCQCKGRRIIDLTSGAYRRLAPLSTGVIPVTIEAATLPATYEERP